MRSLTQRPGINVRLAGAALATAALCTGPARADELGGRADWGLRFRSVYHLESWRQDVPGPGGARLTQGGPYVEGTAPVLSWLRLEVASGYVATEQRQSRVVGLEDTRLAVSARPFTNLLLRAGTSFPTGEAKLDTLDLFLARGVSDRLQSFRTSPLGEGYNYDFAMVGAVDCGPVVVGLGIGYLMKREYRFFDASPAFDPADQLSVSGGIDFTLGRNFWRLDAAYYRYSKDRLEGEGVYQLGRRLVFVSTFRRPVAGAELQLRGAVTRQAKSELLGQSTDSTTVTRAERASEFYANSRVSGKPRERLELAGSIGARWIGANLRGVGDGWRVDLSPDVAYTLSDHLHLAAVTMLRYSWGRIDARASEQTLGPERTDLRGFAVEAGLQIGGRR